MTKPNYYTKACLTLATFFMTFSATQLATAHQGHHHHNSHTQPMFHSNNYIVDTKRHIPNPHWMGDQHQNHQSYYRNLMNQLKRNQKKWSQKRVKKYRFTMQYNCRCMPKFRSPINVRVKQGQIKKARNAMGHNMKHRAKTMEQMFAMIRNAIHTRAHKINVQYHPHLGYPASIYIDYNRGMADEELNLKVTNFKRLKFNQNNGGWNSGSHNNKPMTYCAKPRPQFCTKEFIPVCGIARNGVKRTYGNGCSACSDRKVVKHYRGHCK